MSEKDYQSSIIKNIIESISDSQQTYLSNFLNPFQQQLWESHHKIINLEFWGGYPNAERKVVLVTRDKKTVNKEDFDLVILQASLTSYNLVGHRQVLGSIMHQGLKRDVIGDILVDSNQVQMIVKGKIADFFLFNPINVNREVLNFKKADHIQILKDEDREIKSLIITSLRLDVVLANVLKKSRSQVQSIISDDRVLVNFLPVRKATINLKESDYISIRGFGRVRLIKIVGRSKKGKIMIEYENFGN